MKGRSEQCLNGSVSVHGYRLVTSKSRQVSKVCVAESLLSSFKLVPEYHTYVYTHSENHIRSSIIGFTETGEVCWSRSATKSVREREREYIYPHLAARANLGPIHRQATRDRKTKCNRSSINTNTIYGAMTTAIQFANDKPTPATSSSAQGCTMSRAARPTSCPKEYVAGGIRDLNGVVQLPLVTEWPL